MGAFYRYFCRAVNEQQLNTQYQHYTDNGFCLFDHDDALFAWVASSLEPARLAVSAKRNRHWFRHDNTWFVGVNALPNKKTGRIGNGPALQGGAVDFIQRYLTSGDLSVDRGQISVCYPGYPKPSIGESELAYGYRLRRDAAHIDGVMRVGVERNIVEHNDYILALPMVKFSSDAAPLVVWQGSHKIMQVALSSFLADYPVEQWSTVAITDVYTKTRKQIFANCQRIEVQFEPGQSLLGHRHLLHGTAPWGTSASAGPDGRMICFFRPQTQSLEHWVSAPT